MTTDPSFGMIIRCRRLGFPPAPFGLMRISRHERFIVELLPPDTTAKKMPEGPLRFVMDDEGRICR